MTSLAAAPPVPPSLGLPPPPICAGIGLGRGGAIHALLEGLGMVLVLEGLVLVLVLGVVLVLVLVLGVVWWRAATPPCVHALVSEGLLLLLLLLLGVGVVLLGHEALAGACRRVIRACAASIPLAVRQGDGVAAAPHTVPVCPPPCRRLGVGVRGGHVHAHLPPPITPSTGILPLRRGAPVSPSPGHRHGCGGGRDMGGLRGVWPGWGGHGGDGGRGRHPPPSLYPWH